MTSTFMHELLGSLLSRWREVDILLDRALIESTSADLEFHDVLCRSAIVLTAAHLEGFIRDCANALIEDINRFSSFKESPAHIKRTFCNTFIRADDPSSNAKATRLIQTFDSLNTKLALEPFLFDGKNDDQKNASPGIIQKIAKNFGVDKIFSLLAESKLDTVFSGLTSEIAELSNELRDHLAASVEIFPYSVDTAKFNLNHPGSTTQRTLWESFLDNLLRQRNMIAHGTSQENGSSAGEIREIKEKIIILQYGVMLVLCKSAVSTSPYGRVTWR